jgi:hypothetical protein
LILAILFVALNVARRLAQPRGSFDPTGNSLADGTQHHQDCRAITPFFYSKKVAPITPNLGLCQTGAICSKVCHLKRQDHRDVDRTLHGCGRRRLQNGLTGAPQFRRNHFGLVGTNRIDGRDRFLLVPSGILSRIWLSR